MRKVLLVLILVMLNSPKTLGATWKVNDGHKCVGGTPSLAVADVQACIDRALDGDIVELPAGAATWKTGVQFCASLTIQGAGADETSLTADGAPAFFRIAKSKVPYSACPGKTIRFAGMMLNGPLSESNGYIDFNCISCSIRIDHVAATGSTSGSNGRNRLVHITFWKTSGVITNNTGKDIGIYVEGLDTADGGTVFSGNTSWSNPSTAGSGKNMLYVENNTFTSPHAEREFDCANGGRVTYRHNTFENTGTLNGPLGPFNHGYDSVPRACYEMVIYNNRIIGGGSRAIQFRGGHGVVYNNQISGTWTNNALEYENYRSVSGNAANIHFHFSLTAVGGRKGNNTIYRGGKIVDSALTRGFPGPFTVRGFINPTNNGIFNVVAIYNETLTLENPDGVAETHPGSAMQDSWCDGTQPQDGNTVPKETYFGWPCFDQVGRGMNQTSLPIYSWGNCTTDTQSTCTPGTKTSISPKVSEVPDGKPPLHTADHIQANRDFYDQVENFDGTVGVGRGPLKDRPKACNPGVGYWTTDTETLYQCNSARVWTSLYVPFRYPFP